MSGASRKFRDGNLRSPPSVIRTVPCGNYKKFHCGAFLSPSQQGIVVAAAVTMAIIAYGWYEGTGAVVRVQLEQLSFRFKKVLNCTHNLYVLVSTT